jgi:TatA/E family protein of Tat protein translocase
VGLENPIHLLFIALVALLVLGPKRLPELARTLGNGVREFREAISGEAAQSRAEVAPPVAAGAAPPPVVEPPVVHPAAVSADAGTAIASTAAAAPALERKALTQTTGLAPPVAPVVPVAPDPLATSAATAAAAPPAPAEEPGEGAPAQAASPEATPGVDPA